MQLEVLATNRSAIRLYECLGFVREGLLRAHVHVPGGLRDADVVVYGLLAAEWSALEQRRKLS